MLAVDWGPNWEYEQNARTGLPPCGLGRLITWWPHSKSKSLEKEGEIGTEA